MASTPSHGQFLLLLRVTGVKEPDIDKLAKRIHDAYMEEYGGAGAITVALLKLGNALKAGTNVTQVVEWNYAVRYFGPTASVAWLQEQLESVAKEANGEVQTQTFTVSDLTGRY